jgi:hypothetical protein
MEERVLHAGEFQRNLTAVSGESTSNFPVFVDSYPENGFLKTFAPWPERFYVIERKPALLRGQSDFTSSKGNRFQMVFLSNPTNNNGHRIYDLRHFLVNRTPLGCHLPEPRRGLSITKEESAQFGEDGGKKIGIPTAAVLGGH